jgi:hypothetical protein
LTHLELVAIAAVNPSLVAFVGQLHTLHTLALGDFAECTWDELDFIAELPQLTRLRLAGKIAPGRSTGFSVLSRCTRFVTFFSLSCSGPDQLVHYITCRLVELGLKTTALVDPSVWEGFRDLHRITFEAPITSKAEITSLLQAVCRVLIILLVGHCLHVSLPSWSVLRVCRRPS